MRGQSSRPNPSSPLTKGLGRRTVQPMPESAVTDKKMLAEFMYEGNLPADVKAMLRMKRSWRYIANVVNERFDGPLTVTHETLRQWYGSPS